MGTDHQHNSDKFGVTWGNLDMLKGLAKGTMVSDSGIVGGWTWTPDGTGGGVRSYDPDKSGQLTFNVLTASLLQEQLHLAFNQDDIGRNVFNDLTFKNNDKGSKIVFHNAHIVRAPPFELATEASISPWVFQYTGVMWTPNILENNVLGSGVTAVLPPVP
jgi:hypothetical protein